MAPVAMILGGISGTLSAFFGWIVFGLTFWGAVQVYFIAALLVSSGLIAFALLRPRPSSTKRATTEPGFQRA